MAASSSLLLDGSTNSSTTSGNLWLVGLFALVVVGVFSWWWWRRYRLNRSVKRQLAVAKDLIFLKVTVPREQRAKEDEHKDFRELISIFEPLLATLAGQYQGRSKPQPIFSLEIVAKNGEIFFYVAVRSAFVELVERQIHGQYPAAQIEQARDFTIFEGQNQPYEAAELVLAKSFVLPLRTYRTLEVDPLNSITSALSKLSENSRGAVQIVLEPIGTDWQRTCEKALENVVEGKDLNHGNGAVAVVSKAVTTVAKQAAGTEKPDNERTVTPKHQQQAEVIKEKLAKSALQVTVRCVVTSPVATEAAMYTNMLLAAFSQLNAPDRNSLRINRKAPALIMRDYLLRRPADKPAVLNTEEITSLFHFPNRLSDTPNIHWLSARKLAPPVNLPREGIRLGESNYRGELRPINLLPSDRMRHLYMVGKTGVGKTVLFENMIVQDIMAGHGVAYLDPNGDAVEWILAHIPKSRAEDVIYFNPADTAMPFGLNLLEWKKPEDRDFLVQEAISIFYKLFDPGKTGIVGPQFEHWFRNAALTLMADPDGGTLVELPRLFVDKEFEQRKVSHVTDPMVRSFWEKQLAQTSASAKSEMLNYFISKFGRFMTNDMMRNIIGQTKSSFDFREVMDGKKILLVNLSKGLIGDINAQLLGMILVTKLQMAAFSRQDVAESAREPFYLYIDEFQNFTTDSLATIMAEARKYGLSLSVTNQYIAQLEEPIKNAVLGNVGTMIVFRVGANDAEVLLPEFEGLTVEDMVGVEKQQFYIKMLIENAPTLPFTGRSAPWSPEGHTELAAALKELSRLKFGRDGAAVTDEIMRRSRADQIPVPPDQSHNPVVS